MKSDYRAEGAVTKDNFTSFTDLLPKFREPGEEAKGSTFTSFTDLLPKGVCHIAHHTSFHKSINDTIFFYKIELFSAGIFNKKFDTRIVIPRLGKPDEGWTLPCNLFTEILTLESRAREIGGNLYGLFNINSQLEGHLLDR
ncbi:hypothetical protein ACJX0J_018801, partial [Zea mays]